MKDNWSSYGDFFAKIDFDGFFKHFRFFLIFQHFRYFVTVFLDILLILAESDLSFGNKKYIKKLFSILLLFFGGLPLWVVCYFVSYF